MVEFVGVVICVVICVVVVVGGVVGIVVMCGVRFGWSGGCIIKGQIAISVVRCNEGEIMALDILQCGDEIVEGGTRWRELRAEG